MFLYLLTALAIFVQLSFAAICLVAGLYYLAEFVEEYTVFTKKVITWTALVIIILHIGLLVFEGFPLTLVICGIFSQFVHLFILKTFPYVNVTSTPFIMALLFLVVNHYLAFHYFGQVYYPFSQVMAYFTLGLWLVPFTLFVSLSANDYVLPTLDEHVPLIGNDDIVSKYLSRNDKKYGLLTLLEYAKETLLPQRSKKLF